jgi:hypothetical protein
MLAVSDFTDFNLGFFQNGRHFKLDAPAKTDFLEGDMQSTEAARLGFKQQCGL